MPIGRRGRCRPTRETTRAAELGAWRTPRPNTALATLAALTAVVAGADIAAAQRADHPHLGVSPTIIAEPASQALLGIEVGQPRALPKNSFVRLRGLPPSVSLTEGHAIEAGAWAVPLFSLPTLKANIPAGVSGRAEITVSLVTVDGTLLAEARTVLLVAQPAIVPSAPEKARSEPTRQGWESGAPPTPVPARRSHPQPYPLPPDLSAQERAQAERLLARGEEYLANGKVEAARVFFQRAADAGLAAAALRLAATYDPAELQHLQVRGIPPDLAMAKRWYERANELGAAEAVERLARLGGS